MTPLIFLYTVVMLASLEVYAKRMKSVRHGKVVGIVQMDLNRHQQVEELSRVKRRIDDMPINDRPIDKEYQRRAAPTATPDTAQCVIEVRVVQRKYGLCERLGMGPYSTNACVAGSYLNMEADNGCNPPIEVETTGPIVHDTTIESIQPSMSND